MGARFPGRRFRSQEPDLWVEDFGRTGTSDDSPTLQAAVNAAGAGLVLGFRRGRYDYGTTLQVSTRSTRWNGQVDVRAAVGGTELCYSGAGAAIQFGTDNGHAWDALEYDGLQDHWIRDMHIRAAAPDTGLALDATKKYRAGTYGIRDWRGGGIRLESVGLEGFEYNFWGVQSDINRFRDLWSIYSKYGIYAGPRSDQFTIADLYSFYCDRALTVDGARQVRLVRPEIVGCGAGGDICAIEVRRGAACVVLDQPWLESGSGGYNGSDGAGFVGVGLVDGYGANGTSAAKNVAINDAIVVTPATAIATHTRCIVRLGKGADVRINRVGAPVGYSVGNLDAFVLAPSGTAFTAAEAFASIGDVSSSLALSKLFANEGTGTPSFSAIASGVAGVAIATSTAGGGLFTIKTIGAIAGAEEIRIHQSGLAGEIWMQTPGLASGQTTRLRLARSLQFSATCPPVAGVWTRGDVVLNTAPSAGGKLGAVCTQSGDFAGTPPIFKLFGAIDA